MSSLHVTESGRGSCITIPTPSLSSTTTTCMVVKLEGPFVWHKHDETDDFVWAS